MTRFLLFACCALLLASGTAGGRQATLSDGQAAVSERGVLSGEAASAKTRLSPRSETCRHARRSIAQRVANRRTATWRHQDNLWLERSPTRYRERTALGCPYLRYLRGMWARRADYHWRIWARLQWDTEAAILFVFGRYGQQALAVARCEAGTPPSRHATNGQYLGIFQMGSFARSTYGHSDSALGQARAAWAYFDDSGRDWSPWSCKP